MADDTLRLVAETTQVEARLEEKVFKNPSSRYTIIRFGASFFDEVFDGFPGGVKWQLCCAGIHSASASRRLFFHCNLGDCICQCQRCQPHAAYPRSDTPLKESWQYAFAKSNTECSR